MFFVIFESVTIAAILNECPVYSRVTIVGKLFSISQTALNMKKSQPYKECKIVDGMNVVRTITFLIQHIKTPSKKTMFLKSLVSWFQNIMVKNY